MAHSILKQTIFYGIQNKAGTPVLRTYSDAD